MRISQYQYDDLLQQYGADFRSYSDNVRYLTSLGYTYGQAKNAVYKFKKKGLRRAVFRTPQFFWNMRLDNFGASTKSPKECIDYLINEYGATYSQANSAVYQYRKNRGLINSSF